MTDVRVPLHVCDVPCSALRKEPRYFERRVQVDDKKSFPSMNVVSLERSNVPITLTLPTQHRDWSG